MWSSTAFEADEVDTSHSKDDDDADEDVEGSVDEVEELLDSSFVSAIFDGSSGCG